jgi:hypothetical protein
MPEFSKIPHVNQSARDKLSASSFFFGSLEELISRFPSSRAAKRNRSNGE